MEQEILTVLVLLMTASHQHLSVVTDSITTETGSLTSHKTQDVLLQQITQSTTPTVLNVMTELITIPTDELTLELTDQEIRSVQVSMTITRVQTQHVVTDKITTVMVSQTSQLTQDVVQQMTQLRLIVMVLSVTTVVMMTTTVV